MATNIKVAVRLRPLLQSEIEQGSTSVRLDCLPAERLLMIKNEEGTHQRKYKYDKVLDPTSNQSEVFEQLQMSKLINKIIEGYHATIFAYGQTGSGKTYTMEGYEYYNKSHTGGNKSPALIAGHPDDSKIYKQPTTPPPTEEINSKNSVTATSAQTQGMIKGKSKIMKISNGIHVISKDIEYAGLIPRSINELYNDIQRAKADCQTTSFKVYCSFLQIYNERIYDLLRENGSNLRLRWNKDDQFSVEGLAVFECTTAQEAMVFYNCGVKNKIMATHSLNIASSRSHTLFSLTLEQNTTDKMEQTIVSKLQLVDLAGSEKIGFSQSQGKHFKESIDINKSLFTLRKVIKVLADKAKDPRNASYIPYRDSKLTSLLKYSLGGNSYCLMIACLTPSDSFLDETISTLNYASHAAHIKNDPVRNDDPKSRIIKSQKHRIEALELELSKANSHIAMLTQLAGDKLGILGREGGEMQSGSIHDEERMGAGREGPRASTTFPKSRKAATPGRSESPGNQGRYGRDISLGQLNIGLPKEGDEGFISKPPLEENEDVTFSFQNVANRGMKPPPTAPAPIYNRGKQNQGYIPGPISDRLIESINMVKELLQSNKALREANELKNNTNEEQAIEINMLQIENQEIRDKVEVLDSILQPLQNAQNYDWFQTFAADNPGVVHNMTGGDKIVKEVLDLRKVNRNLEARVQGLESQNFNMTQNLDFHASNMEPIRPQFSPKSSLDLPMLKTRMFKTYGSRRESNKRTTTSVQRKRNLSISLKKEESKRGFRALDTLGQPPQIPKKPSQINLNAKQEAVARLQAIMHSRLRNYQHT